MMEQKGRSGMTVLACSAVLLGLLLGVGTFLWTMEPNREVWLLPLPEWGFSAVAVDRPKEVLTGVRIGFIVFARKSPR
jgi:hypothetical protein